MVAPARWLTASPNQPWRSSSSDPAIAMSKPGFTTWRPPPRTDVPVGQTGVSAGASIPVSVSDCDTMAYFAGFAPHTANVVICWSTFDVLAIEAVNRCGPSGPTLVRRLAVVSEVENAPPPRTTVPVGQLAVAGVVACGGLSALANAIL